VGDLNGANPPHHLHLHQQHQHPLQWWGGGGPQHFKEKMFLEISTDLLHYFQTNVLDRFVIYLKVNNKNLQNVVREIKFWSKFSQNM
jgi:hypothetical protein